MSKEAMKLALEKIATVNAMDYEYQAWAREALAQTQERITSKRIAPYSTTLSSLLNSPAHQNAMAQPEQEPLCIYPDCNCPMGAGPEPDWCARGYKHKEQK